MHISHTTSVKKLLSIALATLAHMINVYEICLNTTNYPIFNMQDFIYYMWTSILDCFGQLESPPWNYSLYPVTHTGLCLSIYISRVICTPTKLKLTWPSATHIKPRNLKFKHLLMYR